MLKGGGRIRLITWIPEREQAVFLQDYINDAYGFRPNERVSALDEL